MRHGKIFLKVLGLVKHYYIDVLIIYTGSLTRIVSETGDVLLQYRAREIAQLINEGHKLTAFDYKLSQKILDHIEVISGGKLRVIFLTGTTVTI